MKKYKFEKDFDQYKKGEIIEVKSPNNFLQHLIKIGIVKEFKKDKMYISIKLNKDFGQMKKGQTVQVDEMKANELIKLGVAEKVDLKSVVKSPKENYIKKNSKKLKK